jgi:hypothetical protein
MAAAAIAANRSIRGKEDVLPGPGPGHGREKKSSFRCSGSEGMQEEAETSSTMSRYGDDFDHGRQQGSEFKTEKTAVDQSQLAIRNARITPRYMIDPRYSKFSQHWDLITMFALLFTAIVTPYEVSFLEAPASWNEVDALFSVRPPPLPSSPLPHRRVAVARRPLNVSVSAWQLNRFIDVIFIIDLVLQFFLMYPAGDIDTGVRWVDSRRQIIRNYLTGWFALDFFSIMLMAIDFVTILSGKENADSLGALRVLRVLRALRLIKLVRLVRASRMFKRCATTCHARLRAPVNTPNLSP